MQHHFEAVSSALSIPEVFDIDWDDSTDPWAATVDPGSLVIYCEAGPPWRANQVCAVPGGIAGTFSYPTRDTTALPYARVALCPKFFTLIDPTEAEMLWSINKSNYRPTRGGTLFHEAQHVHLIVSDPRWCDDVSINHMGTPVKCYAPEMYEIYLSFPVLYHQPR